MASSACLAVPDLVGERVADLEIADAGDGLAEPDEAVPVELVGAPEVVDDLDLGTALLAVPVVVRELVVGDDGAVLVLALGGPEVHA